jgi:N-acetylmuramate 1-kinase
LTAGMPEEQLSDSTILQCAKELLVRSGMLTKTETEKIVSRERCSKIDSDGSTRRFWRLRKKDSSFCLIAAPGGRESDELAESRSAWHIGRHLRQKGVPVPELYGWDSRTGVLLFEDLGDSRLHEVVVKEKSLQPASHDRIIALYYEALKQLANMQYRGAEDFDESWCWNGARYDLMLMVEKESGYFLRAFWQGLLGHDVAEGVWDELQEIARRAGEAPANYFLHRDFQSRNIMIKDGSVRFIDYQAGRLGPLGYDLASLLIDPYCCLPQKYQDELVDFYINTVTRFLPLDETEFKKQFILLAFQRNMQIIGAFSFLYKVKKKPFFMEYIKPSLISLKNRLDNPLFKDYPRIRSMVTRGLKELTTA